MASSEKDRVWFVYSAYKAAYDRRKLDWKHAKTLKQVDAIDRNLDRLELSYRRTLERALNNNGEIVEDAFKAAKTALGEVNQAYESAKDIVERIRAVTGLARRVEDFIRKAI